MTTQMPVSFSFCISDNYAQHLAVALTSILVNNRDLKFVFHVLHHGVTLDSQSRIRKLENSFSNCTVRFHDVGLCFNDIAVPATIAHVTKEAYFRLLLPEILLDECRTIYSDVDVLCVGSLKGLWEIDLQGNPIAAISDNHSSSDDFSRHCHRLGLKSGDDYYCSGLLVMDLEKMRQENASARLVGKLRELEGFLLFPDQDVVNSVFAGRILPLESIWNCTDEYSSRRKDVRQWHFQCQTRKPWCNIWKNRTWLPYLRYLRLSPYRTETMRFIWGHIKGFFWFSYVKNRRRRWLFCGIRVWRRFER